MTARLSDIAAQAGVSEATVSRVVNGKAGVSPTTRQAVVAAMGQAAVHALLEEVAGTPAPHAEFVFQPELVVRGSTAARRR